MSKIDKIGRTAPYIDRRVAEGIFRELLGERPTYRVFNIYGKSGSGKTTFIKHIKNRYLQNNNNLIYLEINFNNRLLHKPQSAIMHIAKELEKKYNFNFLALWKAYAILWHQRYEHSPIMYAADLPYFEEIKELVKPKKNRNILDIAKGIFGSKLAKELEALKSLDTKSIEAKLYQFFAADLRRIIKNSKYNDSIIILENLDTLKEYNSTSPCSKDAWVRDLITNIGKDSLFLISSNEKLNWHHCNSSWSHIVKEYEMKSFTKKDSLRYLLLKGIKDSNLKEAIAISATNEPFWLSLGSIAYSKLYKKLPTTKIEILKAFFNSNEESLVKLLNILVHGRFFTVDLIDVAKEKFSIQINSFTIQKLLNMPFIKELDSHRFIIDNVLKEKIIEIQESNEIVEYRAFMFSYYENILQSLDSKMVKTTPKIVDESIEEAWYHLNSINSEPLVHFEWLDYYIDRFFMYAAWEPFLERYNKIVPHLRQAQDRVSKEKLVSLYNNLAGLYESLGDTKISKKYYDMVINLNRPELLSA